MIAYHNATTFSSNLITMKTYTLHENTIKRNYCISINNILQKLRNLHMVSYVFLTVLKGNS